MKDAFSTVKKSVTKSPIFELPTYLVLYGPPLSGKSTAIDYLDDQGFESGNVEYPNKLGNSHSAIEGIGTPEDYFKFRQGYCKGKAIPLLVLIDASLHLRMARAEELGFTSEFYKREANYRVTFEKNLIVPKYTVNNNLEHHDFTDALHKILVRNGLTREILAKEALAKKALAKDEI